MSGYSANVFTRSDDIGNFLIQTNEAPLKVMEFPDQSMNLPGNSFGIFVPARYRLTKPGSIDLPVVAHSKKHASVNDAQWMNAQLIPDKYISDVSSVAGDVDHRDISFDAPKTMQKQGFVLEGNSSMFARFYNVNADGTTRHPIQPDPSENRKNLLAVYKNQLKNADDLLAMGRNVEAAEAANQANEMLLVQDPTLFASIMAGRNVAVAPAPEAPAPNVPMAGAEAAATPGRHRAVVEDKIQILVDREMDEKFQDIYDGLPNSMSAADKKASAVRQLGKVAFGDAIDGPEGDAVFRARADWIHKMSRPGSVPGSAKRAERKAGEAIRGASKDDIKEIVYQLANDPNSAMTETDAKSVSDFLDSGSMQFLSKKDERRVIELLDDIAEGRLDDSDIQELDDLMVKATVKAEQSTKTPPGSPIKPVEAFDTIWDEEKRATIRIMTVLKDGKATPEDILDAIAENGLAHSADAKEVEDSLAVINAQLNNVKGAKRKALYALKFATLINNYEGIINADDIATFLSAKNIPEIIKIVELQRELLGPENTSSSVALRLAQLPKRVAFADLKKELVAIMRDSSLDITTKHEDMGRVAMDFVNSNSA
jgi:hypothetical protein